MALKFLNNAKDNFINALFGTPTQVEGSNQSIGYGKDIDNYLNNLGEQEYIKKMLNKPVEERMSLDTIRKGVVNGLNYGIPEIVKAQKELGINTPKTGEEIYKAQLGEFNQPTTLNVGVSNAPRQGGLINDFISGFRENATQGFDVNNLAPQNKGLVNRIGEGLGTLVRFYNKPIGRFAAAAGLSMLTDEANPLGEGVKAYVGRQGNLTRDKAYRQNLIQMGFKADEINSIPGIMTDSIYENLIKAKQLQEQQKYREMYLENQKQQNELMNQFRRDQLKAQELERAAQREDRAATRALTARGQNLNYDVAMRKLEADANKETAAERKEKAKLKQAQNTINMISKAKETVQNNPNAFGYIQGALGADVSNRIFKGGTQARSTINSVAAEYRKYLTGAQMSDRERLDYEKFLPSPKDNAKIINDKLNAMLDVISAREGIETTGNGVTNVGNYKVRVKQ